MNECRVPYYVISGFACSIIFIVLWIVSAAVSGTWQFGHNSLSDLGVCGVSVSEVLFNYGCVLTGFLGILMGFGIFSNETGWMRLCGIATLVSGTILTLIGVINESYGIHMIISGAYGVSAAICMALSGFGDFAAGRRRYMLVSLVLLLICGAMNVTQNFETFEAVAISCILTWILVQSWKYYRISQTQSADDE